MAKRNSRIYPDPLVLIVDDEPMSGLLTETYVASAGYSCEIVNSTPEALESIQKRLPDIIISDIVLPGMDGFSFCQKLKSSETTSLIPVILVSAFRSKNNRIMAIESGAADFFTKPVQKQELISRISSLLKLKRLQDKLKERNRRIRQQNAKLRKLDKIKEGLTAMIIHDLKSPLTTIRGYLDIILLQCNNRLDQVTKEYLDNARNSCERMQKMILTMLDISRMEKDAMEFERLPVLIRPLFEKLKTEFEPERLSCEVDLELDIEAGLDVLWGDMELLLRVLENLIHNAFRHTPSGSRVTIRCRKESPQSEWIRFAVSDEGAGIPLAEQQNIFKKFYQLEARKRGYHTGRGLGLTFCKYAVELQGGKIWVESKEGIGSSFFFRLPWHPPTNKQTSGGSHDPISE